MSIRKAALLCLRWSVKEPHVLEESQVSATVSLEEASHGGARVPGSGLNSITEALWDLGLTAQDLGSSLG